MKAKDLGLPKISLQFELSNSGITRLVKAEAAVEEIVTVVEEEEVDDDDNSTEPAVDAADVSEEETKDSKNSSADNGAEGGDSAKDGAGADNATEKDSKKAEKPAKKKKKTIMVEKVRAQPSLHPQFYIQKVTDSPDFWSSSAKTCFRSKGKEESPQEDVAYFILSYWPCPALLA